MFRPLALQPLLQHLNGVSVERSLAASSTDHRCRATHGHGTHPSLGVCHLLGHGLIAWALGLGIQATGGPVGAALTAGLRSLVSSLLDDTGRLVSLLHRETNNLDVSADVLGIDHPIFVYPIQVIHQSGRYRPQVIPSVT
ncbi:MAG: hypothetical protein WBA43_20160 [Elainellaceae cyanobacterium]|jgi:hypothetical protein